MVFRGCCSGMGFLRCIAPIPASHKPHHQPGYGDGVPGDGGAKAKVKSFAQ